MIFRKLFGLKDSKENKTTNGTKDFYSIEQVNNAFLQACKRGEFDNVNLLLKKGADVDVRGEWLGQTALLHAIKSGSKRRSLVALLLEAGADPNLKGKTEKNAALNEAVRLGDADLVKMLLEAGADVNIKDGDGRGPMWYAVAFGYIDIVKCLIDKGADVNEIDKDGSTATITAAYNGRTEIVRSLLENGADVNVKNKDAMTAVMYALQKGHSEIVEMLNKAGATISESAKGKLERKGKRNVERLIRSLKSQDQDVRWGATKNLVHIGEPAVESLIQCLNDNFNMARLHAAWALWNIGDPRAIEPLIQLLDDAFVGVRNQAVIGLGKIGDGSAVEPLIEVSKKDEDSRIREEAKKALEEGILSRVNGQIK